MTTIRIRRYHGSSEKEAAPVHLKGGYWLPVYIPDLPGSSLLPDKD
jgi:hypothetical protein